MTEPTRRPCRSCGMQIEFREGPSGKQIPLQKVRSVYALREALFGDELERSDVTDHAIAVYVSHFETCPGAGQFSRKGKT